jgi:hypothetical protein
MGIGGAHRQLKRARGMAGSGALGGHEGDDTVEPLDNRG